MIKDAEMVLVDNSNGEWEHWYGQGRCEKPSDWKVIRNDKKEMKLETGTNVKLLFKFQSFREPVYDFGVDRKIKSDKPNEMKPRQIKIEILGSDGSAVQ